MNGLSNNALPAPSRGHSLSKPIMKKLFTYLFTLTSLCAAAAEPSGYYASCEGKSGKSLLTALCEVVGPHTTVSYSGLWTLYATTDTRADGSIWDMYSTKHFVYSKDQCGQYSKVGDCYNREHSFPKSWFNDKSPMVSDAFHIYPTDGRVNGQRSNYPFGECASGTTLPSNNGVKALGKLGSSTFSGYSGTVFEPDDEYKGDFARSYFYMAAAYNGSISGWSSPMLAGNAYPAFSSWAVNLLLKWHRQDPVSQKELDRNEAVYAAQRNRNPFIDHPELAEHIWGNATTEDWNGTATSDPQLLLPAEGTSVDLGRTVSGVALSRAIVVRGTGLKSNVSVNVSGAGFTASPASVSQSVANSANGANVVVTFTSATAGNYKGTMTLSCGNITRTVALAASVISTLPVGPVTEVSDDSFTATWTNVGDADRQGCYTLDVTTGGTSIAGYPRTVSASAEAYNVSGLEPSTEYTYTVASQNLKSEPLTVRTHAPQAAVEFLFDGHLDFVASVGEPSEVAELWVDIINIDSDVTLTVPQPFQLSMDRTEWGTTVVMQPEEDRVYLRMLSDTPGTYHGSIYVSAKDYYDDDVTFTGTVTTTAGLSEDFEADATGMGSYTPPLYQGSGAKWKLDNAGMWPNQDKAHSGTGCVRLGKNSTSTITMEEDYPGGLGVITVWMALFGSDATANVTCETSTDGGKTWTEHGSAVVDSPKWQEYSFLAKSSGPVRMRLRQTSGARLLVDDITSTNYTALVSPEAEAYHTWDAFCRGGELVVTAVEDVDLTVYALDGTEVSVLNMSAGEVSIPLAPGLYIVAAPGHTRRVVIR